MRRALMVVALLGTLTVGCAVGASIQQYPPAQGPAGAAMRLQTSGGVVTGELLAVGESALLLVVDPAALSVTHTTSRLVWVPISMIHSAAGPDRLIRGPGDWTPKRRERYRLISRYPGGVAPELESRLVAAYGVDAVQWMKQ